MSDESESETIFAPATAPGLAGIAVIRISGAHAGAAVRLLTGRDLPPARSARLSRFVDPRSGGTIDRGLVLWFPGPRSFTGEDAVELHLHGGRAVTAAMIGALSRMPGLRLAERGEFTRRAYDHGKLDLTSAEGLADLVAAETEAQRRQALRQLDGELGRIYDSWRARLLRALAHAEAEIDFPDEGLPAQLTRALRAAVQGLSVEIAAHLADRRRGERLRDGFSIAIIGPPNAGKSSLLNWLARREAAIVSATAGTTRDVIEVRLDLGGYPVIVADTAGLRDLPADAMDAAAAHLAIEREGIRRARARAEAADLKLLVLDAAAGAVIDAALAALIDADTLILVNKTDLAPLPDRTLFGGRTARPVSVRTGAGLSDLLTELTALVAARLDAGPGPALTRERHRAALSEAQSALDRSLAAPLPELMAEDLRLAARALGRITGRVAVDDILDLIFHEFCIGK